MTVVVWVFAVLAATVHIVVFVCEAFFIERPRIHDGVFGCLMSRPCACGLSVLVSTTSFLRCGIIVGVVTWISGDETVGRTLVIYICLFMILSGIVLIIGDRLGFGGVGRKSIIGGIGQSLPPLVALVAALL